MKFLMIFTMLVASATSFANEEWAIKCFEKDGHELDLAYIIKVDRNDPSFSNRRLELLDCTRHENLTNPNCRERGELRKIERQEETCLVLNRRDDFAHGSWSLCYEQQELL